MAVVCNPIRMGRWSELMVVCVCHSDEVMREAGACVAGGDGCWAAGTKQESQVQ